MKDKNVKLCHANIALIGFMGAGKTTIGRLLSDKTGMLCIDSDEEIEKITKIPIPAIFQIYGDGYFRRLEQEFCNKIVPILKNTVISTGGGIVLNKKNIDMLRLHSNVFYLKSSPQKLYSRLKDDTSRPVLQTDDKLEAIKKLLADREPFYESCAHHVVDTDELDSSEIVKTILTVCSRDTTTE